MLKEKPINMRHLILLVLTLFNLTLSAQDSTASVSVSSFTILSPQLNAERKIWVYLPHDYKTSGKRYPVIYMHDGQNLFDRKTSAYGEWRVDETLDSLKAEVIVIGIEHGGENRIKELTPFKNAKYGGGEADNYLDFLVNTVKPYADKTYRTKPDADNTTIWGSSLGGLVSYYAVLKYPEVFGKAGVFSPAFWINKEIFEIAGKSGKIKGKIYFMTGDDEDKDMVPDLEKIHQQTPTIVKHKNQVYKKIVKGGRHNETLWSREFAAAYLWLMKG